jgi:tetratricopeptide (TPR) repeat protein
VTREVPPYFQFAKGLLLEGQGRWAEAASAYRLAALQDSTSQEPWLALADVCRRLARWPDACEAYQEAGSRGAVDATVMRTWLRCCARAENVEGTRAAYKTYLDSHPGRVQVALEALRLELQLGGEPDSVLVPYGELLAEPAVAEEVAKLLLEGGFPGAAESFLESVAHHLELALWQGVSLEAQGKTAKAASLYEALLDSFPDDPRPVVSLFNLWRKLGESSRAVEVGKRLVSLRPDSTAWAKAVAAYAVQEGMANEALRILRDALLQAETESGLHYMLATVYARTDSLEHALREALVAIELDSTSAEPVLLAGWVVTRLGRRGEAIGLLRDRLQATGRDLPVLLMLGSLLVQEDSPEEAIPFLEEASAGDSSESRVFYELGVAYERVDRIAAAASAFRRCLHLDPSNASAYNYLGYMLADRGLELEKALQLIRKALGFEPENGYFVDSLGWVYYRLGMLEDARRELERAAELVADDPVIREHLGRVYLDSGMRDEAEIQLRTALELGSADPEVQRSLDALAGEGD